MARYTFIGSKETVKEQVQQFLKQTEADELIVATNMYDIDHRLKSFRLFAEIMAEINEEYRALQPTGFCKLKKSITFAVAAAGSCGWQCIDYGFCELSKPL